MAAARQPRIRQETLSTAPCASRPTGGGSSDEPDDRPPSCGQPRPINDSWIAACCIARDLPLATFNVKDYADFVEDEGLGLVQ